MVYQSFDSCTPAALCGNDARNTRAIAKPLNSAKTGAANVCSVNHINAARYGVPAVLLEMKKS